MTLRGTQIAQRGCLRFQYLSGIEYRQSGFGRDRGASSPFSQRGMEDHAKHPPDHRRILYEASLLALIT